jgi:heme/copper-type cytochrome/quinol oxidase subunit 2
MSSVKKEDDSPWLYELIMVVMLIVFGVVMAVATMSYVSHSDEREHCVRTGHVKIVNDIVECTYEKTVEI